MLFNAAFMTQCDRNAASSFTPMNLLTGLDMTSSDQADQTHTHTHTLLQYLFMMD